jgi:hypothetical protein
LEEDETAPAVVAAVNVFDNTVLLKFLQDKDAANAVVSDISVLSTL